MELLSDELLLHITQYVPVKDQFLTLQYINKAFHRVVWDNLNRCLLLGNQSWLKNEHFKSLLADNNSIVELSLQNCYWIHSSSLKPLKACVNLRNLNLLGCCFAYKTILHILSGIASLDGLALTVNYEFIVMIGRHFLKEPSTKCACKLSKLHLQFEKPASPFNRSVSDAVESFTNGFIKKELFGGKKNIEVIFLEWMYQETNTSILEGLWDLVCQAKCFHLSNIELSSDIVCQRFLKAGLHPAANPSQHQHQLHIYNGLGIVKDNLCEQASVVSYPIQSKLWYNNLISLYIHIRFEASQYSDSCCDSSCTYPELPFLEYLTIIIRPLGKLWAENLIRFANLRELNLCGVEMDGKSFLDILFQGSIAQTLISIALSVHSICGQISDANDESNRSPKRKKLDLNAGCLAHLHSVCPQLKELELYGWCPGTLERKLCSNCSFCFYKNWVDVAGFRFHEISLFTKLTRLTLVNFPMMRDFSFLSNIGRNCKQLKSLRIANLGLSGYATFSTKLKAMLPNLPKLEELSIHHGNFDITSDFLMTLSKCSNLHQLCIQTISGVINPSAYLTFIDLILSCKFLTRVVCFVKFLSTEKIKQVQRRIKKIKLERPPLQLLLLTYHDLIMQQKVLPSYLQDITSLKTKVAVYSPSQYKFYAKRYRK
ncbi:F-box/LRR-repeat protein 18-like isoform X2 [Clavelina lepadiformis]|uniref:F-box/LRR-repeat protein 18-like isoform X2 n=1 Tax=Clavelina lepadiformis TaxID=159417 RepID=UPI00404235F6